MRALFVLITAVWAFSVISVHYLVKNPPGRCTCERQDGFMQRAIDCEVREAARDHDRGDLFDALGGVE